MMTWRPWRRCPGTSTRPVQRPQRGLGRLLVRADAAGATIAPASGPGPVPRRLGGGDGGEQLLDRGGEPVALGGQGVVVSSSILASSAWWSSKRP
jgi:hypothetical protein